MSFEDGLSRKPPDDFLVDDCLPPALRFDSLLLFESGIEMKETKMGTRGEGMKREKRPR